MIDAVVRTYGDGDELFRIEPDGVDGSRDFSFLIGDPGEPFREALSKTTFYKDWKAKFGEEAWSNLEKSSGKLV